MLRSRFAFGRSLQKRPGWGLNGAQNRLARLVAAIAAVALLATFAFANNMTFLMPGHLSNGHAAIEGCSTCHTSSGNGKLGWIHGLVAGDPLQDSKACLTCHKMPNTAFKAHGATAETLKRSTERLRKSSSRSHQPLQARAQDFAFSTDAITARDLYCATCHQEHDGATANLKQMSNAKCRSCHVSKFDSFDQSHPEFSSYPAKQRTPIIFDHAGHFERHFPEVTKKDPSKPVAATCTNCHSSQADKGMMAVAPFETMCAACHLDQITGTSRASGPKGIAFLTVPGLDLATLKKSKAQIGNWPEESDTPLTPFMKLLISRSAEGRRLVEITDRLNLKDLTGASADEIKAVSDLAIEIKLLYSALVTDKSSEILSSLATGAGATPSPVLLADLGASLPRDVVVSAQQQWFPGATAEVPVNAHGLDRNRPQTTKLEIDGASQPAASVSADPAHSRGDEGPRSKSQTPEPQKAVTKIPTESDRGENGDPARSVAKAKKPNGDPPPCVLRLLGQCLMSKGTSDPADKPASGDVSGDSKATPKASTSAETTPGLMRAGLRDIAQAATESGQGKAAKTPPSHANTDQTDDLLYPTEEELRAMKARNSNTPPDTPGSAANSADEKPSETQPALDPALPSANDIDTESWARFGGWYRQDYTIYYRPSQHEDRFLSAWLNLTAPLASKTQKTTAGLIFASLIDKDAPGACRKCHSIDDVSGKGQHVNFAPTGPDSKRGRFTAFTHAPHFSTIGERGCLTCHKLTKAMAAGSEVGPEDKTNATKEASPYLKSYEHGEPSRFQSGFVSMQKEQCRTCHQGGRARQDCLMCHRYHVNTPEAPVSQTRIATHPDP